MKKKAKRAGQQTLFVCHDSYCISTAAAVLTEQKVLWRQTDGLKKMGAHNPLAASALALAHIAF